MEDEIEYEIEGESSFEFVVETGNDVWIDVTGDYSQVIVSYEDINGRSKELKNLREINNYLFIPYELIVAPSDPTIILVDVSCDECTV